MNLGFLLPFDNFILLTNLTQTEVKARFERITEPQIGFRLFPERREKPYEGKIIGETFEISRIIRGRNSFLPLIKGRISTNAGQTQIAIRMRPVIAVLLFMTYWLGTVGLMCLGLIASGALQFKGLTVHSDSPATLVPFGMLAFGYGLLMVAYRVESHKSKAFFKQLLEAEEWLE
ncbi:hypothetical protein [Spirosoma luteum]|uniref:hypothetical protein n=1 Tax=Spirosoma luteum TaxID=431553 RepID=UPI0003685469|nr:hypothetical protein [Spirosoma luteum]